MTALELLAPARNADIGIAAIDCGADAIYIAGPSFGARKDAGNPIPEIKRLCDYAHRFGAKVFVTVNIVLHDDELDKAHSLMLEAQDAGADAFIIRDERICLWEDITVPLHASTQCSIRTPQRAVHMERLGCSRIVLERELSLAQIKEIRAAVDCEIECFVHGALCVCYSGECRLSEHIDGRSGDRGDCIQACRSLYDLEDENGNVLVRNKALLSLKDFRLLDSLEDLAGAGVMSFKIEGRLKNASYVRNVVREYSLALDRLVETNPERYRRASFGKVVEGFMPDSRKTFNRGYTSLFLDGVRGKWSSMDIPKSVGEPVGRVKSVIRKNRFDSEIEIVPAGRDTVFRNGDGFTFATKDGVSGFRAETVSGNRIVCRTLPGLKTGMTLYRNVSSAFEKEMESKPCHREIAVAVKLYASLDKVEATAEAEDGRKVRICFEDAFEACRNVERMHSLVREGIGKHSGIYSFRLDSFPEQEGQEPLLSSAFINGIRRKLAGELDRRIPERKAEPRKAARQEDVSLPENGGTVLMRSRYCIKYELGLCRKHSPDAKPTGRLFLVNNGRRFALDFDCNACEMSVESGEQNR